MTTEGFPSAAASSETAAAMAALALFLAYMCHGSGGPVPDPTSCAIHPVYFARQLVTINPIQSMLQLCRGGPRLAVHRWATPGPDGGPGCRYKRRHAGMDAALGHPHAVVPALASSIRQALPWIGWSISLSHSLTAGTGSQVMGASGNHHPPKRSAQEPAAPARLARLWISGLVRTLCAGQPVRAAAGRAARSVAVQGCAAVR